MSAGREGTQTLHSAFRPELANFPVGVPRFERAFENRRVPPLLSAAGAQQKHKCLYLEFLVLTNQRVLIAY